MIVSLPRRARSNRVQQDLEAFVRKICERSEVRVVVPGDVDVENIPVVNLMDSGEVVIRQSRSGITEYEAKIAVPVETDPLYGIKVRVIKSHITHTLRKLASEGKRVKIIAP